MSYTVPVQIHFDEADPAGVAFFASLLYKVHRAYESFVAQELEDSQGDWFLNPLTHVPINHCEAHYFHPLRVFQTYQMEIKVSQIQNTSFQLRFLVKKENIPQAKVHTNHVYCLKGVKTPLPNSLVKRLKKWTS